MIFSMFVRDRRRSAAMAGVAMMVLLMSAPASAGVGSLGFEEAVRLAVNRAPSLAASRSQTVAAREDASRAAALPDPKLTLGIENLPVTGGDAFDLGAEAMTMQRVGVMQEFPAHAKREARQVVADRAVDEARALTVADLLSVHRVAAEAWIGVWAATRELAALQALREQSVLAIRISRSRLASGTGSAVDTMGAQAAALELDNRIDAANATLDAARSALARWTGASPDALAIEGRPPDFEVLPTGETTLLSSVDRQGPLLPWQSREARAEAEVGLAAAEKRPDWSVTAAYGRRQGQASDMLTVEFAVGLPLFTKNRQDRGIAARRAELDAVAASREDARRAQLASVQADLANWNGLRRQVARRQDEMLPLATDRARTALAGYRGGGELQPWLDARRDQIELQVGQARLLDQLGRAWAALAYLLPDREAQQ